MNDLTTTRELFAYTAWADASVWTAVLHEAAASADGRVRDYLFHIHAVQGLFLAVWRGAPLQAPPKEAPGLTFLLASAQSTHAELASFLGSLDEASLSEGVRLPWAGRFTDLTGKEPALITMGETLPKIKRLFDGEFLRYLGKSLFEIAEVLRRRVPTPQRFAGRILSALDSCPINLVFGRVA